MISYYGLSQDIERYLLLDLGVGYTHVCIFWKVMIYMGFPCSSVGKESACNAGDPSSIPRGRSAGEGIGYPLQYSWASWWLSWWRICLQSERPRFDPWVGKIPWRWERLPTPVFLPGESRGWRSPVGYSPWSRKELHTTEQLSTNVCAC